MLGVAVQRAVLGVRDDRVHVSQQHEPPRAGAGQPQDDVPRVVGRGALHALDLRLVGGERHRDGHRLLGPVDVARRRGDGDERLQLARGAAGDARGGLLDPGLHPGVSPLRAAQLGMRSSKRGRPSSGIGSHGAA
jgi:hypothetical protein